MGSPLMVIMRKVKEISTQLANQLKKSIVELPNSSVREYIRLPRSSMTTDASLSAIITSLIMFSTPYIFLPLDTERQY